VEQLTEVTISLRRCKRGLFPIDTEAKGCKKRYEPRELRREQSRGRIKEKNVVDTPHEIQTPVPASLDDGFGEPVSPIRAARETKRKSLELHTRGLTCFTPDPPGSLFV
jgi:hypothetical protein